MDTTTYALAGALKELEKALPVAIEDEVKPEDPREKTLPDLIRDAIAVAERAYRLSSLAEKLPDFAIFDLGDGNEALERDYRVRRLEDGLERVLSLPLAVPSVDVAAAIVLPAFPALPVTLDSDEALKRVNAYLEALSGAGIPVEADEAYENGVYLYVGPEDSRRFGFVPYSVAPEAVAAYVSGPDFEPKDD